MNLFVLDTDHLTLYQFGHERIVNRIAGTSAREIAITIISVEEQLRAWYSVLRQARDVQ